MAIRAIKHHRGRLAEDPRGLIVSLAWHGRTLLGDVMACRYQEHPCAGFFLTVRHFNGEPWPIEPGASAVRVIERD